MLERDLPPAQQPLVQALALSQRLGSGAALAYTLEGFAILAAAARSDQAVRLASAAHAQRAALQYPISPAELAPLKRWLAPARSSYLGDASLQRQRLGGRSGHEHGPGNRVCSDFGLKVQWGRFSGPARTQAWGLLRSTM